MDDLPLRIGGAVLGSAVGDALGAAVEGLTAGQIAEHFGQLRDFSQIKVFYDEIKHRRDLDAARREQHLMRWRQPGLYTDDTQQSLLVIEVLLETGRADRHALAQRIRRCLEHRSDELPLGPFRGYGEGFRQVAANLLHGCDADRCAVDSAGNGAAMRIAPVGLYFHHDPLLAGMEAYDLSKLTHGDIRGRLCASAVAMAAAQLVGTDRLENPQRFLTQLGDLIHRLTESLRSRPEAVSSRDRTKAKQVIDALANLVEVIEEGYPVASAAVAGFASHIAGRRTPAEDAFCLCSVPVAFWHVLHHRDSLEEAVVSAVNAGGDADTIAAMTGGLAGALHGLRAIPGQLLAGLANHHQLELRASALAGDAGAIRHWQDFCRMELDLTLQERRRWASMIAELANV
ncbi:MAG: hypothetical protein GXY33_11140 [Phycisphaerae bacterium]|nr:hypothetical protein [Phycisphaerae bacterium]